MKKSEIIAAVAQATKTDKNEIAEIVNVFLDKIKESLKRGENVDFIGFGNFKVTKRGEKAGHNPRTGEKIIIAAHKAVHFTPSRTIKNALN